MKSLLIILKACFFSMILNGILFLFLSCQCQKQPREISQTIKGQYNDFVVALIYIPSGEFIMGSSNGMDDEKPVHKVKVDAFYLGKYEVTQREWTAVMGNNPSDFKGDDLPVEQVSWNDVQQYLQKLSSLTGKRWRLPTEAEWEYACRAGSTMDFWFGDDKSKLVDYAWYANNSGSKTHPVGQKKPNAWGLFDMHGNVWEWCQDWYAENYYTDSPRTNPNGPSSGLSRVLRGGSWINGAVAVRSASRGDYNPVNGFSYHSFRCLREQ